MLVIDFHDDRLIFLISSIFNQMNLCVLIHVPDAPFYVTRKSNIVNMSETRDPKSIVYLLIIIDKKSFVEYVETFRALFFLLLLWVFSRLGFYSLCVSISKFLLVAYHFQNLVWLNFDVQIFQRGISLIINYSTLRLRSLDCCLFEILSVRTAGYSHL